MTKLLLIIFLLLPSAVFAQAPKDFQFSFYSSNGPMEKATVERLTVKGNTILKQTQAVMVGEGSEKKSTEKSFKVTPKQIDELYRIVQTSGFFTWPVKSEISHQSQVVEEIEVKADGRSLKHSRWEAGLEESFRKLFQDFDRWQIDTQSARF
jgi:hypothetical protein